MNLNSGKGDRKVLCFCPQLLVTSLIPVTVYLTNSFRGERFVLPCSQSIMTEKSVFIVAYSCGSGIVSCFGRPADKEIRLELGPSNNPQGHSSEIHDV